MSLPEDFAVDYGTERMPSPLQVAEQKIRQLEGNLEVTQALLAASRQETLALAEALRVYVEGLTVVTNKAVKTLKEILS